MQQVPPIHCTSSGLPQGAAASASPDSWSALLPASLLATRLHISLEGTKFSLSYIPSLLPPRPPNHTGPSPGPLGQSRLHTPSLVPEGPHGDAVFPHEAPHSTTITLHAWISEVQWLGALPLPWTLVLLPVRGRLLSWALSGHFLLHDDEKQKVQRQGEGKALTPPGHCRFLAALSLAGHCCCWRTGAPDPGD